MVLAKGYLGEPGGSVEGCIFKAEMRKCIVVAMVDNSKCVD